MGIDSRNYFSFQPGVKQMLNDSSLSPASQVVVIQRNFGSKSTEWILYDVYKVGPEFDLEISEIGWVLIKTHENSSIPITSDYVQMTAGLELYSNSIRNQGRKNLKGLVLRCGSFKEEDMAGDITLIPTIHISLLLHYDMNFS